MRRNNSRWTSFKLNRAYRLSIYVKRRSHLHYQIFLSNSNCLSHFVYGNIRSKSAMRNPCFGRIVVWKTLEKVENFLLNIQKFNIRYRIKEKNSSSEGKYPKLLNCILNGLTLLLNCFKLSIASWRSIFSYEVRVICGTTNR